MVVKKKIVLLGDSAVGKTSLIRRYVFDQFEDAYVATIGSKITKKVMNIQRDGVDSPVNLVIWDVLGRAGYLAVHTRTFAGIHGAFLVVDLTRRETLSSLEQYWIPLLFQVAENVPMVFACNKSDLRDRFAFRLSAVQQIGSKYNGGHEDSLPSQLKSSYLTSAKTGENVEVAFESLAHMMLSKKAPKDPIRELYERLVAEGIYRQTDKRTMIGATDALIVDFCEGFDDDRLAYVILRQEFARAGVDIRSPSKEGLLKAVEYLAEAEFEFKDEQDVINDRERWLRLISSVR